MAAEEARSKVEAVKEASGQLRGELAAELASAAPTFSGDSTQLLKFHGIYQQDDRDVRTERKRAGLDVEHICMVRSAIPGGLLAPEQYLAMDDLADRVGNGTLRITSRQGIQFHFVHKGDLRPLIATLNQHLVTTYGGCGDVVRNTMRCPAPLPGREDAELQRHVEAVARRFRPRSQAYYDLWLDGERVASALPAGDGTDGEEPIYGAVYLPRKFKITFAFPGDNCVDVFAHDVGIVPLLDEGTLRGFTVLVGGGMGRSHNNPDTFPRIADPLATVAPDELLDVVEAIVRVQRDHGDRADREHARLKYLVHDWGLERFRAAVEDVLGRSLDPPTSFHFDDADDHLGWHEQPDGRWFLGVKVENGRIVDRGELRLRTGLRTVVERIGCGVRLTPREDLLLTDVAPDDRATVDALLREHGVVPADDWTPLTRNAFACVALPTCGLALAESERVLPDVLDELDAELARLGLDALDLHVRMTGCPNGCARPYTAEVGLVGRGKKSYDVHLGADVVGSRLNHVFAENVPREELVGVLRPVLERYRDARLDDERFGDFCHRVGVDELRAELGNESWVRRPRRAATAGRAAG